MPQKNATNQKNATKRKVAAAQSNQKDTTKRKAAAAQSNQKDTTKRKAAAAHSKDAVLNKKRTANKGPKRVLIGIGAGIVVLLAIVIIWLAAFVNGINQNIKLDSLALDNLKKVLVQPETPDDPYYMLILGSDSRNASDMGEGRSDTLILARIDPATPQVTLISIPRDTPIQLEGYGTQKINAAFAYGGEAGAVEAVSKFCGVPISHYVELDFTGVEDLVNLLGGVEVNVPVRVLLDDVRLEPGLQWLDGHQALIMSRCRSYPSGDFQRVVNQRILISAVAKRILASNPTELPGLVEELARCVKTDVGATDALDLMLKLRNLDVDAMYMATVPSYPAFHDGASFVDTQEPEFSEMMDRVRAGLDPGVPPDPDVKY